MIRENINVNPEHLGYFVFQMLFPYINNGDYDSLFTNFIRIIDKIINSVIGKNP